MTEKGDNMAKTSNTKEKTFELLKILFEESDEHHPLRMRDLIGRLNERGFSAERKSVGSDINVLRLSGFNIVEKSNGNYHFASRPFESKELTFLFNQLQASPSITVGQTKQITDKLLKLTSKPHAEELVKLTARKPNVVKMENEEFLDNLEVVIDCLKSNSKVKFLYKKSENDEETERIKTPVNLCCDGVHFYVYCFDEDFAKQGSERPFKSYRVDRMYEVKKSKEPAERNDWISNFSVTDNLNSPLGVLDGNKAVVTLEFGKRLESQIKDLFGDDYHQIEDNDSNGVARGKVTLSPKFYSWVALYENQIKILKPSSAIQGYKQWLTNAMSEVEKW